MDKNSHLPVQDTNDSSTVSKVSTSRKGYFVDPFIEKLVPLKANRSPLINRGYYIRCKALDNVLTKFLTEDPSSRKQVLSLGAGFDASYFRLSDKGIFGCAKYFEVDFPRVVANKISKITTLSLSVFLDQISETENYLNSLHYAIIGCDVTDLALLQQLLEECGLDVSVPTLIVSECVLTYIKPSSVNDVIRWSSSQFHSAIFCTYEQVYPDDGFGVVMQDHFQKLSSPLLNIQLYRNPESHERRFRDLGWLNCKSCSMNDFYHSLPEEEKQRINAVEVFDEFEEFELKCSHYLLLCASTNDLAGLVESIIPTKSSGDEHVFTGHVDMKPIESSPSSAVLSRYAHSSVLLPNSEIVCIGGFGISNKKHHQRLSDVVIVTFRSEKCSIRTVEATGNSPGPIVHHTATLLRDQSILIVGGRNSPYQPNKNLYQLHLPEGVWKLINCDPSSDHVEPRWRHSATSLELSDGEGIMVIGGKTSKAEPLDDCYVVHTQEWKVEKLPIRLPEGQHSHVAIKTQAGVVISGGLSAGMEHINNTVIITMENDLWTLSTIQFDKYITSSYSILQCVGSDSSKAYLFCADFHSLQNSLVIVNTETLSTKHVLIKGSQKTYIADKTKTHNYIAQKVERGSKFLPKGFTIHCIGENIYFLGGGGNCFSFGTSFNEISCFCTE